MQLLRADVAGQAVQAGEGPQGPDIGGLAGQLRGTFHIMPARSGQHGSMTGSLQWSPSSVELMYGCQAWYASTCCWS